MNTMVIARFRQHRTAIDFQSDRVRPALEAAANLARVRQCVHGQSVRSGFRRGSRFELLKDVPQPGPSPPEEVPAEQLQTVAVKDS